MRRILSLVLILLILSGSAIAFANIDEKLEKHWSKDLIQKDFLAYYFPYLARDNFSKFDPRDYILEKDFALSLASLSKDYDLDSMSSNIGIYETLTREEIVNLVGRKLAKLEDLKPTKKKLPFQDINRMDKDSIELLRLLYNLGIISGVSKDSFAPENQVTQAEAIIILQRVRDVLEGMREVVFNIRGIVQSYNNEESIIVKEEDDKVLVTLTKMFPTPGYGMNVEKIVRAKEGYEILLNITPPKDDAMQLQVITYKTMTIEIDKSELKLSPPYVFTVEGIKGNLAK